MNVVAALSSLVLLAGQSQGPNYFQASLHEQLTCAPLMLTAAPGAGIRVIGNDQPYKTLFAPGDGVIIDAGSLEGIKTGQQYFVRRVVRDQFIGTASNDLQPISVHTAGWVTVVDVKDTTSLAQITHACDGVIAGDYLEPFVDPPDPPVVAEGAPDYEHPGTIVMGDERRQTGSAGTLMMFDRGSEQGVSPGQIVTIFRDTMGRVGPVYDVGRATVVSVRPQNALLRIDNTHDAVYIGDRVAINRIAK
jgi:hypothetical protein